MPDDRSIELVDSIHKVIEPHASYLSRGPEDENRYLVPVEILEALAWIVTNVLLPVVTGVAVAVVSARIDQKDRERTLRAMEVTEEELRQIKRDVSKVLAQSQQLPEPTDEAAARARERIIVILKLNGWPTDLANRDAEAIISEALQQLWPITSPTKTPHRGDVKLGDLVEAYLVSLVHKVRDQKIIEEFSKFVPEFTANLPDELHSQLAMFDLTPFDAAVILDSPGVEIPLLPVNDAEQDQVPKFEDPSTTGRPVDFLRVMSAWEYFQEGMIKDTLNGSKAIFEALASGYTMGSIKLLQAALESFYNQNGKLSTQQFIERLWQHRWIYEADICAQFLIIPALLEQGSKNAEESWASLIHGEEPRRILAFIEERLAQAKVNSKDLNDWFENLYLVAPWVKYAALLYKRDPSDDGRKYLRWLDEVVVDIASIWLLGVEMLRGLTVTEPYYWGWRGLEGRGEDTFLKKAMKELSYGYRARVQYPRFWFEAIIKAVQEGQDPPAHIGEFDPRRLISIYITYSPARAARELTGKQDRVSFLMSLVGVRDGREHSLTVVGDPLGDFAIVDNTLHSEARTGPISPKHRGALAPDPTAASEEASTKQRTPAGQLFQHGMELGRGCLPVAKSFSWSRSGESLWTVDRQGSLFEVDMKNNIQQLTLEAVCPHCHFLRARRLLNGIELQLLGQWGDVVKYQRADGGPGVVLSQSRLMGLDKGEVSSCVEISGKVYATIVYPNHSSAELAVINRGAVQRIAELGFGYKPGTPLAASPSSNTVICLYGRQGTEIVQMDYRDGRVRQIYRGHELWVDCCAAVESRDLLVSGGQDRTLRIWRLSTGELLDTAHVGQVFDIVWVSGYNAIVALCSGAHIGESVCYAWNLKTGSPRVTSMGSHKTHEATSCMLLDEERLVSGPWPMWLKEDCRPSDTLRLWLMEELVP